MYACPCSNAAGCRPLVVVSSSCRDSSSPLALAAAAVFVVVGVVVGVVVVVVVGVGVGVGCRRLLNGDIRPVE